MLAVTAASFVGLDFAGAHLATMLFKTQSASVYGIDAYLVEVEVDVGWRACRTLMWWDCRTMR
jgi:hypothetical protein